MGGPKFRVFFFLSRHHFALFVSLWVSSRGMLVVFLKRRGPVMCTFGVLGLSCETPAALGEGKKKSEILGGPAEGAPAEGSCGRWCGGLKGWGPEGARRGGGPKGWGPEPRKGGARRIGGPKNGTMRPTKQRVVDR